MESLPSLANPREGGTDSILPEYEGHIIRGRLLDVDTNEPRQEEVYALAGFAGDDIRVFGGQADKQGNVAFYTNRISGLRRLGLATYSAREADRRIELMSPFASHTLTPSPVFSINPAWKEQLLQRSIGVQALYSFANDSAARPEPPDPHFNWKPDVSYRLDEYTRFAGMQEMFIEFIPYLRFRMVNDTRRLSVMLDNFSPGNYSLALLDGIPVTDHNFLYNYDPRRLKRVDIYRSSFYFGGRMFDGIVLFTSFRNDHPTLTSSPSLRLFDYEGTQLRRRFHAPSYAAGGEGLPERIPDYRHTLLWMPEVPAGGLPSVRIPFATSDFAGSFCVTVEGLTKDGRAVRAVTSFEVEGR
jgi:hypothetical protein